MSESFEDRFLKVICWIGMPAYMFTYRSESGLLRAAGYIASITLLVPLMGVGAALFFFAFLPCMFFLRPQINQ